MREKKSWSVNNERCKCFVVVVVVVVVVRAVKAFFRRRPRRVQSSSICGHLLFTWRLSPGIGHAPFDTRTHCMAVGA